MGQVETSCRGFSTITAMPESYWFDEIVQIAQAMRQIGHPIGPLGFGSLVGPERNSACDHQHCHHLQRRHRHRHHPLRLSNSDWHLTYTPCCAWRLPAPSYT